MKSHGPTTLPWWQNELSRCLATLVQLAKVSKNKPQKYAEAPEVNKLQWLNICTIQFFRHGHNSTKFIRFCASQPKLSMHNTQPTCILLRYIDNKMIRLGLALLAYCNWLLPVWSYEAMMMWHLKCSSSSVVYWSFTMLWKSLSTFVGKRFKKRGPRPQQSRTDFPSSKTSIFQVNFPAFASKSFWVFFRGININQKLAVVFAQY